MTTIDDILKDYEKPDLTLKETEQVTDEASNYLWNYLCGDGDIRHLYDYYECMEKISC
jgi:hypothetical protein